MPAQKQSTYTHANGGLDPLGQILSFEALAEDFGVAYQVFTGLYRNRPLSFYKQRASELVGWRR